MQGPCRPTLAIQFVLKGQAELFCSVWVISKDSYVGTYCIPSCSLLIPFFLEGEEDEDEEDEEEEDEEEEDEEEDEEDKDTESLDDSLDGDAELPGFTLPGITSQEPGFEQGNLSPLDGATDQVPDAIEWEQQNQGLGKSCACFFLPPPSPLIFLRWQLSSLALIMEQSGFSGDVYGWFISEKVTSFFLYVYNQCS